MCHSIVISELTVGFQIWEFCRVFLYLSKILSAAEYNSLPQKLQTGSNFDFFIIIIGIIKVRFAEYNLNLGAQRERKKGMLMCTFTVVVERNAPRIQPPFLAHPMPRAFARAYCSSYHLTHF